MAESTTRTAPLGEYSFEIYGGALAPYYRYDCKGDIENVTPAVISYYRSDGGNIEPITPEILNKPF